MLVYIYVQNTVRVLKHNPIGLLDVHISPLRISLNCDWIRFYEPGLAPNP
jgi:hypothetical protein